MIFLSFFAITFGNESKVRKEALDKIQEVISKEHELVSLGGQAAAAAHSLGTPLSTIKIISQDLFDQFKNKRDVGKDLELLVSQVDRCNEILKKLTLNPSIEDDFIDKDLSLYDYVREIVNSFEEISDKNFNIDIEQNSNSFDIRKSIEIVYGIRNFIGNANKFAKKNIFVSIISDSEISYITIEDDGPGFSKDILNKIGEPYIKSLRSKDNTKSGLGLGIFIGKTLLEKNQAKLLFRNTILNPNISIVIGGGDSAAILNKIGGSELKKMIKRQIGKLIPSTVNRNQISIDFLENDSYQLWNYFTNNFFVSTGGGASLEFLQGFLEVEVQGDMASYLPGTATLMEPCVS